MNLTNIFAGLFLLLAVLTGLQNLSLKSDIETLEQDKTTLLAEAMIKRMELTGLINSLGDQEKKIQAFEETANQMLEARLKAQQESAGRIQQLTGQIARLEQDKGASCTVAGIGQTILSEVLP